MTLMSRLGALVAAVVLAQAIAVADVKVYRYHPEKVELTGRLTKKTFYGPPGYGEDPAHDTKERVFVLALDEPIAVVADTDDYTSHDNVRSVQVRNPGRLRLEALLGKVVRVSGTLDSASIGHDHTDVLIDAAAVVLAGAR